jgi:hypothetical protein
MVGGWVVLLLVVRWLGWDWGLCVLHGIILLFVFVMVRLGIGVCVDRYLPPSSTLAEVSPLKQA